MIMKWFTAVFGVIISVSTVQAGDRYEFEVNDYVITQPDGTSVSGGGGRVRGEGAGLRHAVDKSDGLLRSRDNGYINALNRVRRPVYGVVPNPYYAPSYGPYGYYPPLPSRRFTYGVYLDY
jgi:hypothetical protein